MPPMRWLALALLMSVGCATTPKAPADTVAGQLVVGTEAGAALDTLPQALALEGYTFAVVSSASESTHLVEVKRADGTALSADETQALVSKLSARKGVRYVELNRLRQPK